jgi:hypothetical protein
LSYHAVQSFHQGTDRYSRAASAQAGIPAGDPLDAHIEAGCIVLTPRKKAPLKAKILTDPITGLPALSLAMDAPVLSSKDVEEILSNFP